MARFRIVRLTAPIKFIVIALLVTLCGAAATGAPVTVPVTGPQMVGVPKLWAQDWTTPPYVLQNPCGAGEPAIVFRLLVNNWGTAASPAMNDYHAIWIQDAANPGWAGGMTLPAIKINNNVGVNVPLVALNDPNQMQGHHVFNVTFENYGGNTLQIPVDFPPAFCKPVTKTPGYSAATSPPHPPTSPYEVVHPMLGGLPSPVNLTNTVTQGVCAAHGGPAGSFACYIGLPAGKLVLVWDYPYTDKIDGYRVYFHGITTSGSPTHVVQQQYVGSKPVATQSDPSVHLIVLDPPSVGTCFDVTAFQGSTESARSATSFCVGQSNVGKTTSLSPYYYGVMDASVNVWFDKSVQDNMYHNGNSFSIGGAAQLLEVGEQRNILTYYQGKPSNWNEVVHRTYLAFAVSAVAGHIVTGAHLNLRGGSGGPPDGTTCLVWYGAAGSWSPGQNLGISGQKYGGSPRQGPDLSLDVLPIVQSWAKSNAVQGNFALEGDVDPLSSYAIVSTNEDCTTWFSSATLDITYY